MMRNWQMRWLFAIFVPLLSWAALSAEQAVADDPLTEKPAQAETESNNADDEALSARATAILHNRCGNCHGTEKQEGSLRTDSREALVRGGDRGPSLNETASASSQPADGAHKADKDDKWSASLLWQSVAWHDEDLQMPPKNRLPASELKLIEQWLRRGAPWPRDKASSAEMPQAVGDAWSDPQNPVRKRFGSERLNGWSWQPVQRPTLDLPAHDTHQPNTLQDWLVEWSRGPIDILVAGQWQRSGDRPAPELSLRSLARRAALDLTGLPPDDALLEQLLSDSAPDAYERFVDRLLASPRYGQHVGRMWLDVVRYSDSNGFDWDEFRRDAWRYRDYVIRSLNSDTPYDRFIVEQLAGDLLQPAEPQSENEQDRLLATGYLRMGPHDNAASLFNEQDRSRAELMADLTETTASAFLAQTFACCRCHDHKTDPFLQEDHYRLRAFFAGLEFDDQRPIDLATTQRAIRAANAPLEAQIAELDKRLKELKAAKQDEDKAEKKKLEGQRREIERQLLPFTHGLLMREKPAAEIAPTFVFYQGDHRAARQQVPAGLPQAKWSQTSSSWRRKSDDSSASTATNGAASRLDLAHWIASADNPWTSRVMTNRLWQLMFGRGLVASGNDFGLTGALPTHPELLDWLASDFVEADWSIKLLMRKLVISSSYRQSALAPEAAHSDAVLDGPPPQLRSMRSSLRRLSAEQLRDVVLFVSGQLELRTGGPAVWPELPPEILQANPAFLDDNAAKTKGWYPSPVHEQYARSIFLIQKRTVRIPMLETFDLPENSGSCACRESSIVAPQALSLLNSDLAIDAAESLARSITAKHGPDSQEAIAALFGRCLQRQPSPEERELSQHFLRGHSLVELARALLNTNELMFVP